MFWARISAAASGIVRLMLVGVSNAFANGVIKQLVLPSSLFAHEGVPTSPPARNSILPLHCQSTASDLPVGGVLLRLLLFISSTGLPGTGLQGLTFEESSIKLGLGRPRQGRPARALIGDQGGSGLPMKVPLSDPSGPFIFSLVSGRSESSSDFVCFIGISQDPRPRTCIVDARTNVGVPLLSSFGLDWQVSVHIVGGGGTGAAGNFSSTSEECWYTRSLVPDEQEVETSAGPSELSWRSVESFWTELQQCADASDRFPIPGIEDGSCGVAKHVPLNARFLLAFGEPKPFRDGTGGINRGEDDILSDRTEPAGFCKLLDQLEAVGGGASLCRGDRTNDGLGEAACVPTDGLGEFACIPIEAELIRGIDVQSPGLCRPEDSEPAESVGLHVGRASADLPTGGGSNTKLSAGGPDEMFGGAQVAIKAGGADVHANIPSENGPVSPKKSNPDLTVLDVPGALGVIMLADGEQSLEVPATLGAKERLGDDTPCNHKRMARCSSAKTSVLASSESGGADGDRRMSP